MVGLVYKRPINGNIMVIVQVFTIFLNPITNNIAFENYSNLPKLTNS